MKKLPCFVALYVAVACGGTLNAAVLNVPAAADSVVNALDPDTALSNTPELTATKIGTSGQLAEDLRIIYAQFDLPGGLTGQQIAAVNDAQLRLTRSTSGNLRLNYHVYGVLDGVDTASANDYTWNSGVGFFPDNKEVRFLTPDEVTYYQDPAESVFVGNIRTANDEGPNAPPNPPISVHGPFDFTIEPNSPGTIAALHDWIKDDTDGRLTFYIMVRQPFGVATSNLFASLENGSFAPPTLYLDYTQIPEPNSFLLALGAVAPMVGLLRHKMGRRLPS